MHRAGQGSQPVTAEPPATVVSIDSRDVFVHATGGRAVALVGVADLIVIDTPDALLISSADAAQEVKRVVDELREHGREDLL
jgi:mannose-1-phosphate guanylyltransferase